MFDTKGPDGGNAVLTGPALVFKVGTTLTRNRLANCRVERPIAAGRTFLAGRDAATLGLRTQSQNISPAPASRDDRRQRVRVDALTAAVTQNKHRLRLRSAGHSQ